MNTFYPEQIPLHTSVLHTLKVQRLHADAIIPKYQTAGAACFDLHAVVDGTYNRHVVPGLPAVIRTGLAFEVPEGFVMMVYSRSGHGFKADVRMANCVGVIDSDYRGELMVKLTADVRSEGLVVARGDRIAQAMLVPVQRWQLLECDTLSATVRGTGGTGSTGQGL